jgi:hypothetical protein
MEMQELYNVGIAAAVAGVSWFIRTMYDTVQRLKNELHQVELRINDHYVRRDDYREDMQEIKNILHAIFDKLDGKADKG